MTKDQIYIAINLKGCSALAGSSDRCFIDRMAKYAQEHREIKIDGIQEERLFRLVMKFMRRLPQPYFAFVSKTHFKKNKNNG